MIAGDRHDRRHQGHLHHISGIQAPPQAHLHDRNVHPLPCKIQPGDRRHHLKLGGRFPQSLTRPTGRSGFVLGLQVGHFRLHLGQQGLELGGGDRLAIHPNPFRPIDQMGRGEAPHPIPRRLQDRRQHRTGRSLPIRPRHMHNRDLLLGIAQGGQEARNARESQIHPKSAQRPQPGCQLGSV